jgi:peptidoglycan/LPS O-acetylase OafA/YrhL
MTLNASRAPNLPRHIPSLDGLRAFSVLLVLFGHVAATHGAPSWMDRPALTSLGNVGVRFFFLISGFLITTLLLREHDRHGRIDLKSFYIRRAYRILPAMWTYLAVMALCHASGLIDMSFHIASRLHSAEVWPDFLRALTFTANYDHDYNWYTNHLWSLSVEEQFYLFWPLALWLGGMKRATGICLIALLTAPAVRLVMAHSSAHDIALSREFQAVADALATGAVLALAHDRIVGWTWMQRILNQPLLSLGCGLGLVVGGYGLAWAHRPTALVLGQSLANVGVALVILHVVNHSNRWPGRILQFSPIAYIGAMSYSLYLWQEPFLYFHVDTWATRYPQNLLLTMVAAWLSYRLIEQPFLRLKERRESARMPGPSAAGSH